MKIFAAVCLVFAFSKSVSAQMLIMPGDHPDPSVVKIGDKYYASATTSNWAPAFPIMESNDLLSWKTIGNVFDTLPQWADYYFWAPEISYDNGRVYVYYAAHKKNGNLCLGIASADKPGGPYKDHGPLMCQEAGSIDAFPIRDKDGKLYMVWKEDANSINKPTPIWIQEVNESRTALTGEKEELFRNDSLWEANLVEGVSIIKHKDFFYAFYAAAGCCGAACTYGVGVARSTSLFGPWEKDPANPIIKNNKQWVCPGHGTPVVKNGKNYFVFHAYDKSSNIYVGRQGVLQEFVFTNDNWISFLPTTDAAPVFPDTIVENFDKPSLSYNWQWSVFQKPVYKVVNGKLSLSASSDSTPVFVAQKTYTHNYNAMVCVDAANSSAVAGLALIGDDENMVSAVIKKGKVSIVKTRAGEETIVSTMQIPVSNNICLSLQVVNGKDLQFLYSVNNKTYTSLHKQVIDGSYLPPWDRGLRVGLVAAGRKNDKALFKKFMLQSVR